MNPVYFETHFIAEEPITAWPVEFAIITACATTGDQWSHERNAEGDEKLRLFLQGASLASPKIWHRRVTGYSPSTGHAEPGWAAELDLNFACRIGEEFLQDAIYFVANDLLSVTLCKDGRRALVLVGRFAERVRVKGME